MVDKEALLELIGEKDALESEIRELESLHSPGVVGPLVDAEGFPRADIDVHGVMTARHRLRCLKNDHKALMRRIEEGLVTLHAVSAEPGRRPALVPFCVVDEVSEGSPAEQAGLLLGDKVLRFGSLERHSFVESALASLVAENVGVPIAVVVLREGETKELTLLPHKWAGRGLLGCHISPLP